MPPDQSSSSSSANPGAGPPVPTGHTVELEARLFEYLDGELAPSETEALAAHLAACAQCQALAHQWQQLDLELSTKLSSPSLSADFATDLWRRVEATARSAVPSSPSQQGVGAPAEWGTDWAQYRKTVLRKQLPAALDYIGYGGLAAIGSCLFFRLASALLKTSGPSLAVTLQQSLTPIALGTAAAVVLVTAAFATRRQVARWWSGF